MIGKRLLTILRGAAPAPDAEAGSALGWGDREAITADLAPADAVEPGLGRALAEYVIGGAGEAVLLRLDALLGPGGRSSDLHAALYPNFHPYGDKKAEQEQRLGLRQRVLYALEGFDPPAVRRYGEVFVRGQKRTYFHYYPGTDRSPASVRELLHMVGQYGGRNLAASCGILTIPNLLALLALDGAGIPELVDCMFSGKGDTMPLARLYLAEPDLADVLATGPDAAAAAIHGLGAPARVTMLGYVKRTGLANRDARFAALAFALAGDGSRIVREAALAVLATAPADGVAAMAEEHLASRDADARLAAVRVLAARGSASLPRLARHETGEASKRVLQAIATVRATLTAVEAVGGDDAADGPDGYTAVDGTRVEAPPFELTPDQVPPDTEAVFAALVAEANATARREYDALPPERRQQNDVPKRFSPQHDPGVGRHVAAVMAGTRRARDSAKANDGAFQATSPAFDRYAAEARRTYTAGLTALLDRPDVSLQALVRLRLATADIRAWRGLVWSLFSPSGHYLATEKAIGRRIDAGADVRTAVAAAEEQGFTLADAMKDLLGSWYRPRLMGMAPNPTTWTLLAAQFPFIDELTAPASSRNRWDVESLVNLMEFFPKLPRRYFRFFLDRASDGSPRVRKRVRALLAQAGDLTPVIVPMLKDGDAKRRSGAARWLGDRRDLAAVPALWAALKAERHVAPRAAILAALDGCGEDISGEFSEERMLAEAERNLPKARADYSAMFDAAHLPTLRWADGRAVPAAVVQWWFAQSHKLKLPGGDPLLHMALDRLDRGDAERLGLAVLSAFVAFDTVKPGSDEANAHAAANAPARHQSILRWNPKYTEQDAFNELRREKLGTYLHSAQDHRGLLALCRHAPPAEAVAVVRRFLRDHGSRNNQCRALLDAMAANPVPAVLQFILATAQRYKLPGTRKHAAAIADALAEERGWSPAELADRTVPNAGLDDDGVLALPVGGRAFRARLADAKDGLALVLENPDGKPVSSLPTPSDPAAAEEAKAARKALSAAKKELKQTVELQAQRLYEAMCAGRTWLAGDFRTFLLGHPVVGRLLRRLVLAGFDAEGNPAGSFRALDDGTFTDAADEPVALDGFAGIGIAHRATLGADAADAWATHLSDYEVPRLFEQLDRPLLALADAKATEITDRLGHMIDGGALQNAAGALGYVRGPVEDGGCFSAYERVFPDLGLVAAIEFTGSYIGNTGTSPGALRGLRFYRVAGSDGQQWRSEAPLGQVPPVLLSEAWNDYHAVAARGTGFDPAWEKKASW